MSLVLFRDQTLIRSLYGHALLVYPGTFVVLVTVSGLSLSSSVSLVLPRDPTLMRAFYDHAMLYPERYGGPVIIYFDDANVSAFVRTTYTTRNVASLRYEARIISGLVLYLLKQGYTETGDITVLTPYLGQLFVLKNVVGRASVLHVQVGCTIRLLIQHVCFTLIISCGRRLFYIGPLVRS